MNAHLARILIILGLAASTVGLDAAAQVSNPAPATVPTAIDRGAAVAVTTADRRFMRTIAQDWLAQVHFGQLATNKSANPQVRELADRMVDDYQRNGAALQRIAAAKGVALPADISLAERREFHRLAAMSGVEFEQAYVKHIRALQVKDANRFRAGTRGVNDPELKAFAQNALPLVEERLEYVIFATAMAIA